MPISPDNIIYWQWGFISVNATLVFTWLTMALLVLGSGWVTRKLTSDVHVSRWQSALEIVVSVIQQQLKDVTPYQPKGLLPFLGSLFLFIALSQYPRCCSGFFTAHRLPFHHNRPGCLCILCRTDLRYFTDGGRPLSYELFSAIGLHDAL